MTGILFSVVGTPAPQGSKRHVGNGVMVESSKKVKPWRQDVKYAALAQREIVRHTTFHGPVEVSLSFELARPKSHFGTGRNADALKPNAPDWVSGKPDLDKLVRSTLDALGEAGVWLDDAQVARVESSKMYCGPEHLPGVLIVVTPLGVTS